MTVGFGTLFFIITCYLLGCEDPKTKSLAYAVSFFVLPSMELRELADLFPHRNLTSFVTLESGLGRRGTGVAGLAPDAARGVLPDMMVLFKRLRTAFKID